MKETARAIAAGEKVFPELSGFTDGPTRYLCNREVGSFASNWQRDESWKSLPHAPEGTKNTDSENPQWCWQAVHDDRFLYVNVESPSSEQWRAVDVTVHVESTHLYPHRTFRADLRGKHPTRTRWLGPEPAWEATATEIERRQTFRPAADPAGDLW